MNQAGGPLCYSAAELAVMLDRMQTLKDRFYAVAVGIGHHQFIEFAGFMGEYINMCRAALDQGIDFGTSDTLPMQPWHAGYIGEKFGCIFGETLKQDPGLVGAFCVAAFGGEWKQATNEGGADGCPR